jgi:uncharacterized protein
LKKMARKIKKRNIGFFPEVTYFKPRGIPVSFLEDVSLSPDELEAIRLVDFEENDQHSAAKKMSISQSTLQRILSRARKKIAEALVVGKAICLKGGEEKMIGFGRGRNGGRGRQKGPFAAGPGGFCVCTNPDCGEKITHQPGLSCYQQKCPKCGSPMIRER